MKNLNDARVQGCHQATRSKQIRYIIEVGAIYQIVNEAQLKNNKYLLKIYPKNKDEKSNKILDYNAGQTEKQYKDFKDKQKKAKAARPVKKEKQSEDKADKLDKTKEVG